MTKHHFEIQLEQDLGEIKSRVSEIANRVARALRNAVDALERQDHELAYRTILDDNPVNRLVEACDQACHHFVARHLPTAGHLRFISSVMRLNIALERVGDYASTICRVAVKLDDALDADTLERIKTIAGESTQMFEQAIKTFVQGDTELARGTIAIEGEIDRTFQTSLNHLLAAGINQASSAADLFGKLVVLSALERIGDQAKNICEYTVFANTGETKHRNPVPVLFVDRDNSALGPMAVSIARKGFPDHGVYSTAGLAVATRLDEATESRMAQLGHDLEQVSRADLNDVVADIGPKTVVVVLEGKPGDYLTDVPFNTVVISWDLSHPAGEFEVLYGGLTALIRELMTTLRGDQP